MYEINARAPERLKGRGGTACQKGTCFGIGAPFFFYFYLFESSPGPPGQREGGARAPPAPPVPASLISPKLQFSKKNLTKFFGSTVKGASCQNSASKTKNCGLQTVVKELAKNRKIS